MTIKEVNNIGGGSGYKIREGWRGWAGSGSIELSLTSSADIDAWIAKYSGSYTRSGTMWVADYQGIYQEVAINKYGIYGGRLSGGVWYDTEAAGADLTNTIGMASWPSVENLFPLNKYRDFSAWDTVTCNTAQDQTGIGGEASTAWTLEDDNAVAHEYEYNSFTVLDDSKWQSTSVLIKKEVSPTSFPILEFQVFGGTALDGLVILNTLTGVGTQPAGYEDGEFKVLDCGDWWFVTYSIQNNSSGNVTAKTYLYPAASTDGTTIATTVGSVVVDWAQFCNTRRCPVHLVPGGSTLSAQDFHFTNDKLIKAERGSIYIEYEALPDYSGYNDNQVLLANGDCEIRAEAENSGISFTDGTNNLNGEIGSPSGLVKAVVSWSNGSVSITTVNGTTTGTYAGNFGDNTIYIGSDSIGSLFSGYIRKVRFYYA